MYIYLFIALQVLGYMCRICRIVAQVHTWQCSFLPPSPSTISGISPMLSIPNSLPNTVPPLDTPNRPQCVMLSSLCPYVLIVQHLPMSENMWCLIFCSCVSLPRMMVSRFIHVPTKDKNSLFLWLHSIPWCICATFSLSSLSLMGIWVGSKSLLL